MKYSRSGKSQASWVKHRNGKCLKTKQRADNQAMQLLYQFPLKVSGSYLLLGVSPVASHCQGDTYRLLAGKMKLCSGSWWPTSDTPFVTVFWVIRGALLFLGPLEICWIGEWLFLAVILPCDFLMQTNPWHFDMFAIFTRYFHFFYNQLM